MNKSKNPQGKVVAVMPELPEIESIKRVIEPQIQGLAIDRVTVNRPEVIANPDAAEFCGRVSGQSFAGMERRGKFLIFSLESGDRLIVSCCFPTPSVSIITSVTSKSLRLTTVSRIVLP